MGPISIIFIILVILEIIFLAIIFLVLLFSRKINMEIKAMLEDKVIENKMVYRESILNRLPLPVQRYFRYSLQDGQKYISRVKVNQSGFIKTLKGKSWLKLRARQYFNCDRPAFIWIADIKVMPLLWITVRDKYFKQKGGMAVKFLSSIPLSNAAGKEMDISSFIRCMAEMAWSPTALLPSRFLRWESIDTNSARAIVSDGENKASLVFNIGSDGKINKVSSPDRYREEKGSYYKERWNGYLKNYKNFNGINIPCNIEGEWETADGNFKYVKLKIEDIEYE